MKTVSCKIKRFDGTKGWYQDYEIPYEKGKTVVWLLTKIREELDPSLCFTVSCLHAICGACGVRINGSSYLTCNTSLDEVLETFQTDKLTFEPMANFEVIRDLVVKWEPKIGKMIKVSPWFEPSDKGSKEEGFKQSAEDFKKISSSIDCILCGVCASVCSQLTVNDGGYLEPFILNKAYRFAADTRSGQPERHIIGAYNHELWKCVHCMKCVSYCPKAIPIADEIAYLRSETMKMGEINNQGARHAYAFYNDIKSTGRLNEMMLPIKTDGMIKTAVFKAPFALRSVVVKRKLNPLHFPKKVKGIKGVRALYTYARVEGEKQS